MDTQVNPLDQTLLVALPGAPQMYVRNQVFASTLKVIGNCTDVAVTAIDADVNPLVGYIRQLDPLGVLREDRDAATWAQVVFITCQRVVRGVRAAIRKRRRWRRGAEEFVVEYESGIGYVYCAAVVGIGCIHAFRARTSYEQIIHNEIGVGLIDLIVLVGVPTDKLLVGRRWS
jgi:hypothetical protein